MVNLLYQKQMVEFESVDSETMDLLINNYIFSYLLHHLNKTS